MLTRLVPTFSRGRALVRLALALIALLSLLVSRSALADEATARAHFKRGIDLYDKKHYAEALAAFQEAYGEKPSAGIKQNIALSLKGLNRLDEAATSFDEALDEGKDTLKPETRAAIERELAELSTSVATVNITVENGERKVVDGAIITILHSAPHATARTLGRNAHRRPIRLMPGIYTFTAHVAGYPEPPEKKLALVSGAPIDVTFVLGAQPATSGGEGTLDVTTNVPDAAIRVDGVELSQRGTFHGKVSAGTRSVEVSAPGWKTTTIEVVVPSGASVEYAVKLQAIGEVPSEYFAPKTVVPKRKRFYVAIMGAADTVSYRLGVPLDEPAPYGTRRSNFLGLGASGRLGFWVAKRFAIEGLVELGAMEAKYKLRPSDALESKTSVVHWQLTPMARFVGPGKVRFTMATGFGVHGLGVESKLARSGSTLTKKGEGIGFSWLVDAGIQVDLGPVFMEFAAFLDVHGVGPVRDDASPGGRLFYASPATRGGLRFGLGIPF